MIDTIVNIAPYGTLICFVIYGWLSKAEKDRLLKANETIMNQWIADKDRWNVERQQLLDRIQAPSFDHLKQAEVRVIRAQKDEKKEQPYELL